MHGNKEMKIQLKKNDLFKTKNIAQNEIPQHHVTKNTTHTKIK